MYTIEHSSFLLDKNVPPKFSATTHTIHTPKSDDTESTTQYSIFNLRKVSYKYKHKNVHSGIRVGSEYATTLCIYAENQLEPRTQSIIALIGGFLSFKF